MGQKTKNNKQIVQGLSGCHCHLIARRPEFDSHGKTIWGYIFGV